MRLIGRFANDDISLDLQVAGKGILNDHWCLEVDVEVRRMLSLLLVDDRVLLAVIQESLKKIIKQSYCSFEGDFSQHCVNPNRT